MTRQLFSFLACLILLCVACGKDDEPQNDIPSVYAPGSSDSTGEDTSGTTQYPWKEISRPVNTQFADIGFFNDANGVACTLLKMYRTTDSGVTWKQVASTKDNQFQNLSFQEGSYVYVNDIRTMMYSSDTGKTWTLHDLPVISAVHVSDFQFVTPSTGFLDDETGVYKTSDTGQTWQRIYNEATAGFYFSDTEKGYIATREHGILKTSDGGNTWQLTKLVGVDLENSQWNVMQFINSQYAWFGTQTTLYTTKDNWETWESMTNTPSFNDLELVNDSTGYRVLANKIYKTTDYGKTWQLDYYNPNIKAVAEICFTDEHHGWACCTDGSILRKFE